jgi:DNA-binding XRE family transcriptional regulator
MKKPSPMQKPEINLKELREKVGWTKIRAAEELGFSKSYYGDVENEKKGISVKMMHAIMKVFKVEYVDFYKSGSQ